jgi:uncharacterized membrane protein
MKAKRIVVTAISIALVTVAVSYIKVPVPATGGYWHLGVAVETFLAIAFGPVIGGVAAGVGAALADLLGGYGSFAPLTLVAHGLTGLVIGLLGWKKGISGMILGWILGGLVQVGVYFLGEATVYGFGYAGALAEVPVNFIQVGLGLLGVLLFFLVKRAYPQIEELAEEKVFQEIS